MNVIDTDNTDNESAEHLIVWINRQIQHFMKQSNPIYCLTGVWNSQIILQILSHIIPTFHSQQQPQTLQPNSLLPKLSNYLQNELGKRMRLSLKNKINISPPNYQSLELGLQLILYICLHTDHKNKAEFINRIMMLQQQTQQKIMISLNKISSQLDNIIQVRQMLSRISELESDNQNLRKQLNKSTKQLKSSQFYILELQSENKELNAQNIYMKKQKQKIYQELRVNNLDDYSVICRKIQGQNILMADYISELQRQNSNLDQSYKDLQKSFGDRSMVIAQLNDEIIKVKEKYNILKEQRYYQDLLDLDLNHSLSGPLRVLSQNQYTSANKTDNYQSVLDISYINNKRDSKLPNFAEWNLQVDDNKQNDDITEQKIIRNDQLLSENAQLRKYNGDLMQKLEDTYKTVQSLTQDNTRIRQKYKKIEKQNKFYQKQLKLLRKLNSEFQSRFVNGQL